MASSWSLALAFNKSKRGRRMAFMGLMIIFIIGMVVASNWTMISYDKMVNATYAKSHNSEVLMADYKTQHQEQIGGTNLLQYNKYLDLKEFSERMFSKHGIKTAKVYPSYGVTAMTENQHPLERSDINGKVLSMADYLSASNGIRNNILTNDPASVGINIIEGRTPVKIGEVAIPKGMQTHFNAVGGIYDSSVLGDDKWVRLTPNELFTHDFGGVNIVGVFEDNLDLQKKYSRYAATEGTHADYENLGAGYSEVFAEAVSLVGNNILSNVILYPEEMESFYRDTAYFNGQDDIQTLQGNFVNIQVLGGTPSNSLLAPKYSLAPATENVKRLIDFDAVPCGTVSISTGTARNLNLKDGDKINIKTDLRCESSDGLFNSVKKEIVNKEFTVRVDSTRFKCDLLFNVEDYYELSDNFERELSRVVFSSKNFTLSDFNAFTKLANDIFGKNKGLNGEKARLEYSGDYLSDVIAQYSGMNMARNYVMIALLIVLVVVILVLGYNIISVLVTAKAKDLLILKSLGANKSDYVKIYGIFALMQLVVELLLGVLIGVGLVFAVSTLVSKFSGTMVVMLPLTALPVMLTMLIVAVVEGTSLLINIFKINDKNLRKSFQKVDE